ncbi:MAG: FecR domain-containing protein [Nitrospirae bacterium]|nr:FecR domain-containing protein [Candidatus Manganitrophaceae bacterium]
MTLHWKDRSRQKFNGRFPFLPGRVFGFLFFLLSIPFVASLAHASSLEVLRISLIEGDVQIETKDQMAWSPASVNFPMREGDRLSVGAGGRAELQLTDGTTLRLNENSAFEIVTTDNDALHFSLDSGQAFIHFRGERGYTLQWTTPAAAIDANGPSQFRIDITEPGDTRITTYQGRVDADGISGKITVAEHQTLLVRAGSEATFTSFVSSDEWERWNLMRDRSLYERTDRVHFLPPEMDGYAHDLDEHGRWQETSEYGPVWVPAAAGYSNWSPYQVGRWVLIGNDYVWVSNEPWGWAPYHYGRWAFVERVGWGWVPPARGAVFWAPGYVAWVHTPTYVAWVPLAPREVYYGYGEFGPYSVNITNVVIYPDRPVYRNFRNLHVHNAIIVVQRNSFLRGEPRGLALGGDPFDRPGAHFGRPPVQSAPPANRPEGRSLRGMPPSHPIHVTPTRPFIGETPPTLPAPPQGGTRRPAPPPNKRMPDVLQRPVYSGSPGQPVRSGRREVIEYRSLPPHPISHMERPPRTEVPASRPGPTIPPRDASAPRQNGPSHRSLHGGK